MTSRIKTLAMFFPPQGEEWLGLWSPRYNLNTD